MTLSVCTMGTIAFLASQMIASIPVPVGAQGQGVGDFLAEWTIFGDNTVRMEHYSNEGNPNANLLIK